MRISNNKKNRIILVALILACMLATNISFAKELIISGFDGLVIANAKSVYNS